MRPVALAFLVILLGVGTVAFAFTYRKGRKHADHTAVAKADHDSDKKAETKPEVSEKKPEEKKPEEKKPAEKVEEKKPVEKKPEEKKPEEKKPAEKKPEEKKPAEKKPEEKKPEEKKPEDKKPAEKKPEEKKPEEKKPAEKPEEKKPVGDPKFASIVFEKDILPIFNSKCIFCHGDKKKKGGLDMRTVALMMKGGDTGSSTRPRGPGQEPPVAADRRRPDAQERAAQQGRQGEDPQVDPGRRPGCRHGSEVTCPCQRKKRDSRFRQEPAVSLTASSLGTSAGASGRDRRVLPSSNILPWMSLPTNLQAVILISAAACLHVGGGAVTGEAMAKRHIKLRGISGDLEGKTWESECPAACRPPRIA